MTSAQQLGRMSVLRKRGVVSILVAMCASRIAAGMIPFGLVTYFASRNDFASAGFSSTIFMIAVSLSGPVKSRIIQKYAPGVIIVSMAIISSVAFCLCIASSFYLHSTIFAFLLIALGAISAPPTGAVVRSAWNQISGSPREKKNFAFNRFGDGGSCIRTDANINLDNMGFNRASMGSSSGIHRGLYR
ncbi:hypothetical protein A0J51_02913 [Gluconobacter japonicus]|nr:hypothetical protein A0J51_02913 [Gluconobacter japonicus]